MVDKLKPLVSIIVVSCRRKKLLKKCLDSIVAQTYKNWELIVIDNASTRGTKKLIGKYPFKTAFYFKKNIGVVKAHNIAIPLCKGDYIIRVDDDMELDKDFIKNLVFAIVGSVAVGIMGGKIYWHHTNKLWCVGGKIEPHGKTVTLGEGEEDKGQYEFVRDVDYIGALMFVNKFVYDRIGLLDEAFSPVYYEDVDFNVRARKAGYRIIYLPDAIAYHNQQPRNPSIRKAMGFQWHRLKFWLKHGGYRSVFKKECD